MPKFIQLLQVHKNGKMKRTPRGGVEGHRCETRRCGALAASYYRGQYFLYLVKTHEVIFYGFKMHICGVAPRCGGRGLVLADADNVEIRNVNDISRNNNRVF